jgi:hypothetical protein
MIEITPQMRVLVAIEPVDGRKGADAYGGAKRVEIAHAKLGSGDRCPGCEKGRVY